MPTVWCIMPEMPAATYSFGAMILPLAPIIWSGRAHPSSTGGRVAPTDAVQRAGELLDERPVLLRADAEAAGDDDVGLGDRDVRGRPLRRVSPDLAGRVGTVSGMVDRLVHDASRLPRAARA